MGVPSDDVENVGRLVGLKTIVNEFAAYERLGKMKAAGKIGDRAAAIATFALCGFANPASLFFFSFSSLFLLCFFFVSFYFFPSFFLLFSVSFSFSQYG
jgi:nucleoside permease NupC